MSTVNLNDIETRLHSSHSGIRKRLDQPLNLLNSQLLGQSMVLCKRNCTRPHHVVRPSTNTLRRQRLLHSAANPRRQGARLAPSMRQLNRRLAALAVDEVGDAPQRRDLRVGPQAGVVGRDAASGLNACGFDSDEASTVQRKLTQVHEMPVSEMPVFCAVCAHGRDDEAVVDRDAAHAERLEERRRRVRLQRRPGRRGLRRGEVWHVRGRSVFQIDESHDW